MDDKLQKGWQMHPKSCQDISKGQLNVIERKKGHAVKSSMYEIL